MGKSKYAERWRQKGQSIHHIETRDSGAHAWEELDHQWMIRCRRTHVSKMRIASEYHFSIVRQMSEE